MNAARMAPSGSNRQPTRFVLVKEPAGRRRLAQLCGEQDFVAEAPVVIAAFGRNIRYNRGGYMGDFSVLVDVSIAVDHLTLAARAEGLGTCWIGSFDNSELKKFLGVPADYNTVALTPLGYPNGLPFVETTDRLPLSELVSEGKWRF
jgi:nitroreductase